ncbi:MAG: hypothetical protein ACREEM_20265, partial [Blastocatellia bacterium]
RMAKRSRPTFQKREKEKARLEKQKEKELRRLELRGLKADQATALSDEDPDIAGIRPGPQPLPEQWDHDHLSRSEPLKEIHSDGF